MSDAKQGSAKAVGTITWTAELEKRFILTAMSKGNPDLAMVGWKEIADDMKLFGEFTPNACQKRWTKIRKEFIADRDAATANKRKSEASEDEEEEGTAQKKSRGKQAASKKAPKKAKKSAVRKEEEEQDDGNDEEYGEM